MFSINVVYDGGVYHFTIVRPDTTYVSGMRTTLARVFELAESEINEDIMRKRVEQVGDKS
jgi:hypothetical protein